MQRLVSKIRARVRAALELIRECWRGPYWWLVPIVLVLLPTAVVFACLHAAPLVAPFVYTVF
jgi:hypothetical protein